MGRVPYDAERAGVQAELLKLQIWAQDPGVGNGRERRFAGGGRMSLGLAGFDA
jgi:hypothetical protein